MSFRDNLQHLRSTRNLTQEQLAMLLGVSRQSVTKWESEKSYPEMDKLIRLCSVFDCTIDDLVTGDLTDRPMEEALAVDADAPATDVCGYDRERERFSTRVSLAVASFILGPALLSIVEGILGVDAPAADVLGVICLMGMIALGLCLVIPAGIEHDAFKRAHPFVEDFYTDQDRAPVRRRFTYQLAGGIACILLGVALVTALQTAFAGMLADERLEALLGGLFLSLVALGVWSIVNGSMLWGMMNVEEYNRENAEELAKEKSRANQVTGSLCGATMLIATIVGLLLLFVLAIRFEFFWVAWPVGGIFCGVLACVVPLFVKD